MKIFWLLFYLVLTPLLIFFYFSDKKIMSFFEKKEEKIISVLGETNTGKEKIINFLNLFALILIPFFFLNTDGSYDENIKYKIFVLYSIYIFNGLLYIFKRKYEWITIIDIGMLIWGMRMFNIEDKVYALYLIINIIVSFIILLLKLKEKKKEKIHFIVKSLFIMIFVIIIQTFYFTSMTVPTGSMLPVIQPGDTFFTEMITYKFKKPELNDIVAFIEPMNNKLFYTKRVSGLPGTTVEIEKGTENSIELYKIRSENFKKGIKTDVEINPEKVGGKLKINNKIFGERFYLPEGIMKNNNIYIPKKGDKIKLKKIIAIRNLKYYNSKKEKVTVVDWEGYNADTSFEEISLETAKNIRKNYKSYNEMIANENDKFAIKYYTFVLESEGHSEMILPILDFKYDEKTFEKLINGEYIELKENYYLALGDNTTNSFDSRYFGLIAESRIKGKLFIRWKPFNKFGSIK